MHQTAAPRQTAHRQRRTPTERRASAAGHGIHRVVLDGHGGQIALGDGQCAAHTAAVPATCLQGHGGTECALSEPGGLDGAHLHDGTGAGERSSPPTVDDGADAELFEMLAGPAMFGGHGRGLHPSATAIEVARQAVQRARHDGGGGSGEGEECLRRVRHRNDHPVVEASVRTEPAHAEPAGKVVEARVGAHQQHSVGRGGVDGGHHGRTHTRHRLAGGDDGHFGECYQFSGAGLRQARSALGERRTGDEDEQPEADEPVDLSDQHRYEQPPDLPTGHEQFEQHGCCKRDTCDNAETAPCPWIACCHRWSLVHSM